MPSDQILPFYVVCDESFSMTDHIDALNEGLRELHLAVGTDPVVANKTRFCLIGFSGSVEILLPLSQLSDITEISGLSAKTSTNFGTAFRVLRDTIERDVDQLKQASYEVCRPAVFFLSDGQPTDPATWPDAFAALTDSSFFARPNMIAFGIGDADPTTIGRVGTFKAFMIQDGVRPGAALHEFASALTRSMVRTGMSASDGEIAPHLPDRIAGFTVLRADRG